MNILIVYDTVFGNTGQLAAAVSDSLTEGNQVTLSTVQGAAARDLGQVDLLIVGSPTRGFLPTPQIREFLAALTPRTPPLCVAVYDTRYDLDAVRPKPLRWVVNLGGYAADRMAATAAERGARVVGARGAFLVTGMEGPLKPGELERATAWAKSLVPAMSAQAAPSSAAE